MQKFNLKEYVDKTVKEVLSESNFGVKPTAQPVKTIKTNTIKENINAIQKNYKLLREYIECENTEEFGGDQMLDSEISMIDTETPEINKFIENIKSESLDAMTQLSRNGESNSQAFETLKKVFDICHNTQKKKEKAVE